jgi:hypothetical protein
MARLTRIQPSLGDHHRPRAPVPKHALSLRSFNHHLRKAPSSHHACLSEHPSPFKFPAWSMTYLGLQIQTTHASATTYLEACLPARLIPTLGSCLSR